MAQLRPHAVGRHDAGGVEALVPEDYSNGGARNFFCCNDLGVKCKCDALNNGSYNPRPHKILFICHKP